MSQFYKTPEEVQIQIEYNAKRRDEMLEIGGIGEMMTAVKFQDRIDGLIEVKKKLSEILTLSQTIIEKEEP